MAAAAGERRQGRSVPARPELEEAQRDVFLALPALVAAAIRQACSKNIIVVIRQGLQALDRPRSPALLAKAIRQGLQLSAATRQECCAAKTSSWLNHPTKACRRLQEIAFDRVQGGSRGLDEALCLLGLVRLV